MEAFAHQFSTPVPKLESPGSWHDFPRMAQLITGIRFLSDFSLYKVGARHTDVASFRIVNPRRRNVGDLFQLHHSIVMFSYDPIPKSELHAESRRNGGRRSFERDI